MFNMQEKQLLQETIASDSSTLVRKEPLLRFLFLMILIILHFSR